jgi:hypothetical protein
MKVTSTGSNAWPRSLAKTSRIGMNSMAAQSCNIPFVVLAPSLFRRLGDVGIMGKTIPANLIKVN